MGKEIWRPIPGWDNYEASSLGQIRSLGWKQYNRLTGGFSRHPGRVLKQHIGKHGYPLINLQRDGKGTTLQVHRLICAAFHGAAPTGKSECCHANDVRNDNRAENLSWGTRKSNGEEMADRDRIKGERHPRAKISAFQAFMIQEMPSYRGINNDLANLLGVGRGTIRTIRSRQNWGWI